MGNSGSALGEASQSCSAAVARCNINLWQNREREGGVFHACFGNIDKLEQELRTMAVLKHRSGGVRACFWIHDDSMDHLCCFGG
jgi:hypothetical protein